MVNTPTTQERAWAVVAHLSALAFGMGLIFPIIGWSEQRRKSNYASFQCLQALGYQTLGYTIWLVGYLLLMVIFLVVLVVISVVAGDRGVTDAVMGMMTVLLLLVTFGSSGLYFLFPIIAAVSCALGRDFRYPVMGSRLAGYLGYASAGMDYPAWMIEEHEDRWVAAAGHFSVIIALWGMIAPLGMWVLQGKRSVFLKFQSVQMIFYQVLTNGLYFGAGFVYMVGFMIFLVLTGFESGPGQASPTGMVGLVALMVSLLIAMLVMLLLPLLHILGQWAGYRVLKGDVYRYPLVGRLVEKWVPAEPKLKEENIP